MKKLFFLLIGLSILFTTSCVMGEDGETYLAYSWISRPLSWHDENPSIPVAIYNGTYYGTNEGRFYMEYTAWDNSSWWMYYTISANPGQFFTDGGPAYFEISLYSFGPTLYKWDYARGIEPRSGSVELLSGDAAPFVEKSKEGPYRKTFVQHGFETMTVGDTTIELEFGLLELVMD